MNNSPIPDGYILFARAVLQSRLWMCGPDELRVAMWLLLKARNSREPKKFPGFDQKRGEVVTSLADISSGTEWFENRKVGSYSRQKIARILKQLDEIGFCRLISDTFGTHLSICNYEAYQTPANYKSDIFGTTMEQQWNNSGTTMDTNNNGKNVKNVEETHTARAGLSQLVNDVIAAINATKVGAKLGVMAFPPIEKTISDMIADGVAGTDIKRMVEWYRENHTKPYVPGFKYPVGFGDWYDSILAARRRIEQEAQGTSNRSGLAIGQIYQGNDDEPLPF